MRVDWPTFAGGELGDDLLGRTDTAKYRTALRRARNVIGMPAGGITRRPGLMFANEVYDSARKTRVIPFQFSVNQGYAMELGHHTLRFISLGGNVLRKELEVTSITNAEQATVTTNGPHGYVVGWDVVFENIEGMTEINGRQGRILSLTPTSFVIGIDTTDFGIFTGSGGGVAGDTAGGTGGDPPPPPPPAPTDPPPETPPFQDQEPDPPVYYHIGDFHINAP